MSELSDRLASRLKDELERRKMTQIEFAHRVGMSEKHVSLVLRGRVTAQVDTYDRWAEVLGMSWDLDLRQVRQACAQHTWKTVMHLDSCHQFQTNYACECGAVRVISSERKMGGKQADPYGSVWALEDCERCQELLAGRKRRNRRDNIFEPSRNAA